MGNRTAYGEAAAGPMWPSGLSGQDAQDPKYIAPEWNPS
jgi:hypothetical protein